MRHAIPTSRLSAIIFFLFLSHSVPLVAVWKLRELTPCFTRACKFIALLNQSAIGKSLFEIYDSAHSVMDVINFHIWRIREQRMKRAPFS